MKPHVICLMASSVDGRTLPSRWRPKGAAGDIFERVHDSSPATPGSPNSAICGRRLILESFEADEGRRLRLTCCSASDVLTGDRSPSSHSCSSAKASHAASMRVYRLCAGSFGAASAISMQRWAFSRYRSDCFVIM